MRTIQLLALAVALALLACSQAQSARRAGPETTETASDGATSSEVGASGTEAPAHPNLPPGVIARAEGKQGVIQVEERDGLRLLTIRGAVQGAIPIGTAVLAGDPVVQLARAVRPKARTALVIGLGTGRTASELAAAGLEVEAVELEPAIAEYARKHFGYEGHVAVGDGIEYLEKHEKAWDVVVMDAAWEINPPPRLVSAEALGLIRRRTTGDGVTLLRKFGEPQDYVTKMIARRLEVGEQRSMPFVHVLGSGVGSEIQNLYFLASGKPLNLVNVSGIPVWPILLKDMAPPHAIPAKPEGAAKEAGPARKVRLVGYLHVMPEDNSLALDLPHWEMGAVRYLLRGQGTDKLRTALPKALAFPTEGDVPSDGDTSKTLKGVLGGGGFKRSDVRFSPVIVALEGTAELRSLVHPNASTRMPKRWRGDASGDDRLPYGGALYDLEVSKVIWTLDRAGWRKLGKRLRPFVTRAEKRARAGDLQRAAKELTGYTALLESKLLTLLPQHVEMKNLVAEIDRVATAIGPEPAAFNLGAACDRTAVYIKARDIVSPDVRRVLEAMASCAERNYEKVTRRGKDMRARDAAARLLALWDLERYDDDRKLARKHKRKLEALRKRYPNVEPAAHPPGELR